MGKRPEYPTCVRHLKIRKDVRLRHFFLCDTCTKTWKTEAFDGNQPLYVGESVQGYCLLCNKRKKNIRLRTWFLCDICHRVAGSIGRNHVAEQAILDYWEEYVRLDFPHLKLIQNDRSALLPRRETDQTATAPIDFLVRDESTGKNVFGIENKTGRSAARGTGSMSQFQLDLSDCDTILNDMRNLNIPAYVIHAQVLEIWEAPTLGFRVVGLWWSDVYTLSEHFRSIRMRRDEMRGAAYFSKKAFSAIDSFADAIAGYRGRGYALVQQYRKQGIPQMYRLDS